MFLELEFVAGLFKFLFEFEFVVAFLEVVAEGVFADLVHYYIGWFQGYPVEDGKLLWRLCVSLGCDEVGVI